MYVNVRVNVYDVYVCVRIFVCAVHVYIYMYILVCVMCKTKRDEETEREEGGSQREEGRRCGKARKRVGREVSG